MEQYGCRLAGGSSNFQNRFRWILQAVALAASAVLGSNAFASAQTASTNLAPTNLAAPASPTAGANPTVTASPAAPVNVYALAAGDRIMVTVLGQPELSGDLVIDGAGDVVLPVIGSVHVEGLTSLDSQELIRKRLSDGYLVHPAVGVRVSEPRPLYILGGVRSPGSYPFRFGSIVKSAIAAAGGYAASDPLQRQAMSESLLAEEHLQQLVLEQAALLVRQARLEAQISGQDTFSLPGLPQPLPPGSLAQIVQTEVATMASQAKLLQSGLHLLQAQKPPLQSEIEAIRAQTANEKSRLELVRAEIERSGALLRQGLGTRTTSIQLKLEEATQQSSIWRLTGEAFHLERELGDLDLRIENAKAALRNEGVTELRTVRSRLAELEVLLPSARAMRDWKLQQAGGPINPVGGHNITITRVRRRGETVVVPAAEMSGLEPGDVIEVGPQAPSPGLPLYSSAR